MSRSKRLLAAIGFILMFSGVAWTDVADPNSESSYLIQNENNFYYKELSGRLENGKWKDGAVHQVEEILTLFKGYEQGGIQNGFRAETPFTGNKSAKSHESNDIAALAFLPTKEEDRPWVILVGGQHSYEVYSPESLVRFAMFTHNAIKQNKDSAFLKALKKINLLIVPVLNVDRRLLLEYLSDCYARRISPPKTIDSETMGIRSVQLLKDHNYFRKNVQGIDKGKIDIFYDGKNRMRITDMLAKNENWSSSDLPTKSLKTELKKGIDLNRNWKTNWDANLGGKEGPDGGLGYGPLEIKYPGAKAGDATETTNLEKLLTTVIKPTGATPYPIKLLVDVHTGYKFHITRSPLFKKNQKLNNWLTSYSFDSISWAKDENVVQDLGKDGMCQAFEDTPLKLCC